jgi:hypothetical protein
MNQETIARAILAVGYTLAKKYPPSSVQMTEGGSDETRYSYSGSFSPEGFQLRESPGGEVIEVALGSSQSEFLVRYSGQDAAILNVSGSSGSAEDVYNSRSYYSINFSSSSIRLDGMSFRVS